MRRTSVFVLAFFLIFGGVGLAHAQEARSLFEGQMRQQLNPSDQRTQTPLGASESVEEPTNAPSSAVEAVPYNAGYDLGSGIIAAGGAFLAAVLIILVFALVSSSRHHEYG